jgi:hypothetical protein
MSEAMRSESFSSAEDLSADRAVVDGSVEVRRVVVPVEIFEITKFDSLAISSNSLSQAILSREFQRALITAEKFSLKRFLVNPRDVIFHLEVAELFAALFTWKTWKYFRISMPCDMFVEHFNHFMTNWAFFAFAVSHQMIFKLRVCLESLW